MRRAEHDTQWMLDGGRFVGLMLGYDFCAEHEFGAGGLRSAFAVPEEGTCVGLASRKIGRCPDALRLVEYAYRPRDKRSKARPAALLYFYRATGIEQPELDEFIKRETCFYSDTGDRWHSEREDIACAWDADTFAIHVRGEANIARIRELHAAFLRCDIVANSPAVMGFFRNGGLAFGILSAFSDKALACVQAQDEAARRLSNALSDTGIVECARANGRPATIGNVTWRDGEPASLQIYLMPQDERKYQCAWLTVDEAQRWAAGDSFLDNSPELAAALTAAERRWGADWRYYLERRIEQTGVRFATLSRHFLSPEGALMLRLWPTDASAQALPFGDYRADELMKRFPPDA